MFERNYPIHSLVICSSIILSILTEIQVAPQNSLFPASSILKLLALLFLFLYSLLVILSDERLSLQRTTLLTILPIILLFLFSIASTVYAEFPRLTLQRSFLSFFIIFGFYIVVLADDSPIKSFFLFSWVFVFIGVFFATLGLLLYSFGGVNMVNGTTVQQLSIGPMTLTQNVVGSENRISSLLGNPNTLAGYLVISIPLTIGLYMKTKLKRLFLFFLLIQIVALILTFSRAGFFATIATIAILISLELDLNLKDLVIIGSIGSLFVIPFFIFSWENLNRLFDLSLGVRGETWKALVEYVRENPEGTGFGISNEVILFRTEGVATSAHSDYFALLAELGLLGITLFLFLLMLATIISIRNYTHAIEKDRLYLAIGISIFLGLATHGIVETTMLRGGGRKIIWSYMLAFITCYPTFRSDV